MATIGKRGTLRAVSSKSALKNPSKSSAKGAENVPASGRAPRSEKSAKSRSLPGQVVLVLQGGGALGAYQVGVYQAMHEAGILPDWVIGTSIGAINGAVIAGNRPEDRLARLHAFWDTVEQPAPPNLGPWSNLWMSAGNCGGSLLPHIGTLLHGIPSFFEPNPAAWRGTEAPVGVDSAAYYSTVPLRETLAGLVDFDHLAGDPIRLTIGAVNACSGQMRYFDTRRERLDAEHVMASAALPPAFPAIRIDGESYWDGGIYSNTPIEAVLEDNPRRDSVIFAVNVWQPTGPPAESIWDVMGRQKDIRYASRDASHIAKQKQIHHLRHVIRELASHVPEGERSSPTVKELASWGCGTVMHVLRLQAPRMENEDHLKDVDFSALAVGARWRAGYEDACRMIEAAPWAAPVDGIEGVVEHQLARRV